MTTEEILLENERRMSLRRTDYDPVAGVGCLGPRVKVKTPFGRGDEAFVPEAMVRDPQYGEARRSMAAWKRLRCRHDFEYWCATCATIRDKTSGRDVRFILNAPQRRVAAVLEADRTAGRPIRMILLKARQWGGSTLVQLYMAWIQSCRRTNWHSLICAHVKDTSSVIRGMYTKLLADYPPELWEGDERPEFKSFERAQNVRVIAGRGCRVSIGSAERQEAIRGSDYAMAHLSETAFWPDTPTRSPADFIRAVSGAIALVADSLVVIESTANGVGNFFHAEWIRCKEGRGDKHAVFVSWHEIEIYRLDPPDAAAFVAAWGESERALWDLGLCVDQIYWYAVKRREYSSPHRMMAEFPTTDTEAFINTGSGVFPNEAVERRRAACEAGASVPVEPFGKSDRSTPMRRWRAPEPWRRYVVAVDVGGRSAKSDWSVIAVVARGELPEVVAQWRGHVDHDILADTAIAMARQYNDALLAIESNTLECEAADSNLFVLARIAARYKNLYRRHSYDAATRELTTRIGFHTNRATKAMLVNTLIGYVRDGAYIEHDSDACNEMVTYEARSNGSFGAKRGYHDDILMTRAIALHILEETAPALTPAEERRIWDESAPR